LLFPSVLSWELDSGSLGCSYRLELENGNREGKQRVELEAGSERHWRGKLQRCHAELRQLKSVLKSPEEGREDAREPSFVQS